MRATIKVLLLHILWVVSGLEDTCTLCPIMALTIVRYHRRTYPFLCQRFSHEYFRSSLKQVSCWHSGEAESRGDLSGIFWT
jgi:hypothetical protein